MPEFLNFWDTAKSLFPPWPVEREEFGSFWHWFGPVPFPDSSLPSHFPRHTCWKISLLVFGISFASVFPDFLSTCCAPFLRAPNNQVPIFLSRTLWAWFAMELKAKCALLSFLFYFIIFFNCCCCVKSVYFLPVNRVGPPACSAEGGLAFPMEWSHKIKIPVWQSN